MEQIISLSEETQYNEILQQAVGFIETARAKVARTVVGASNEMHWNIGQLLYERKLDSKHGDAVVKRLSVDLKVRYPDMGMSVRNLWDMKRFYVRFCNSDSKVRQAVALLPWWNINKLITEFGNDNEAILYYAEQTIAKKWNRDLMVNAISMEMHKQKSEGSVANNFATTLPEVQSEYANQIFKDTYNLGFLGVTQPVHELELERRLVEKVKQFLLELGQGFTYIGNQHVLSLNGADYKVDMLFFHRGLRSLVAIDLKIAEFKPEYVGKMNFYLSLLDRMERGKDENPSIGIILCAKKDNVQVELSLEGFTKPIGVADYKLLIPQKELKQLITDEINSFESDRQLIET